MRNLTARVGVSGSSAPPLTIRTGTDDNGDLVFNDRPEGVGRNSARTMATWNTSANFGYSFTLGKKTVTSGGGVQIMGGPAGLTVNPTGAQTTPRYRLNLSVNINNLWNQPAYSGVQRHHQLAVLPEADRGPRPAADHVLHQRELLIARHRATDPHALRQHRQRGSDP